MPTLPNMGLITPTLGGDSGTWDDKINAAFALVDAHDHTPGKGVAVRVAGLDIDDDLAFGGNAATGLGKIGFTAVAALASGSLNLFVNAADNELYWRTSGGTNVKLTNGSSINTSLVGGIVGDYSAVGAEVAYDDANDTYTFKQESPNPWARVSAGPIRIHEFDTTESVYVEHAVDAALASSYTVTWPAALPATQVAVQITDAGAVVFSNTFTDDLTATDYKFTTAKTVTFSAGLRGVESGGSAHTNNLYNWSLGNSTNAILVPIEVPVGCRITAFGAYSVKSTGASTTLRARLMYSTSTGAAFATVSTATTTSTGNLDIGNTGLTEDVVAARTYLIAFDCTEGNPTGDTLQHVYVSFTRP